MGRTPCCEKTGLKKGPWSREEDHLLTSYIKQHGHQNWRALPKKAGLLRCGKSCRLRWINYLRPDIKRGNFTKEEEDTIFQLHQVLGNRWSIIAAKLPGRTDNEIKNVWHTHLKKKLDKQAILETQGQQQQTESRAKFGDDRSTDEDDSKTLTSLSNNIPESSGSMQCQPNSPSHSVSSSDVSSSPITTTAAINPEDTDNMCLVLDSLCSRPNSDEDFSWLDVVSSENYSGKFNIGELDGLHFPLSPLDYSCSSLNSSTHEDMEFWFDLFAKDDELLQLPEF